MTRIGDLTELVVADSTDEIAIVDVSADETKKIQVSNLLTGETYVEINSTGTTPTATGTNGISIGPGSEANANNSVAIGTTAIVDAVNSIQLGFGTNSTATTLQYRSNTIATNDGVFPNFPSPVNYSPVNPNELAAHLSAIDTELGTLGGDPYLIINGSGPLPTATGLLGIAAGRGSDATGDNSISIGSDAEALNGGGIAIGNNASISNDNAVAIGFNAISSGDSAIQLGAGTNSTSSTLAFRGNRIANAQGLYTDFNAPTNYTPVDDDNVSSHLEAIDTALVAGIVPYQTTGAPPVSTPVDGTLVLDNNGGTTTLYARANGAWVALVSV